MAKETKLLKDTILYGVATFGTSFLSFLMLPLYTTYFTATEFGLWDLVMTTITLLMPLVSFELIAAVYRWLLDEKDEEKRQQIITTGAIIVIRNLLLFDGLALIALLFLTIPYGWLGLVLINIMIVSGFLQQSARGLSHNKLFASLGIIQSSIIVALNLYFIFTLQLRVEAFFYSAIIAGICVIIFAWRMMSFSRYIKIITYSKVMKKKFLVYAIPIIPGAASWWVMTMSDRYVVTIYLGLEYNGIYAVASKIPSLLLIVSSIFFLAWKDSAITEYNSPDKNDYYSKIFQQFFRLMATSLICLTLLTKPLLALFISDTFYSSWQYIGILLLGTLFNAFSLFWSAGFHGAKKTTVILVSSLVGAVINVLINLLLIKHLGLYAVVISTVVAFLITWLMRIHYAKPYFQIELNGYDFIVLFPLIILAIFIPFIANTVGLVISSVISFLLFLGYNLAVIKSLYHYLQRLLRP